ncbi:MAG TPA: hypothetical protein PKI75_00145 [Candidatus Woesebacteria bacterium]|nr:hypothetical protein [Candidatus Woesebacteria bacterium]
MHCSNQLSYPAWFKFEIQKHYNNNKTPLQLKRGSRFYEYRYPDRIERKNRQIYGGFLITHVAGPGVAPGLEDYEPSVLLYTTPHNENYFNKKMFKPQGSDAGFSWENFL